MAKETVLEKFASHGTRVDDSRLPKWLYKYLVFRFNLLDRTGDSVIDNEEFEYVLTEFGVSPRTARQAFTIVTQVRGFNLVQECTHRPVLVKQKDKRQNTFLFKCQSLGNLS